MRMAKQLAVFGVNHAEDCPTELLDLAKKSTMLLRRVYDTADAVKLQAAE